MDPLGSLPILIQLLFLSFHFSSFGIQKPSWFDTEDDTSYLSILAVDTQTPRVLLWRNIPWRTFLES